MFSTQDKIELFARNNYYGWDNWGLEIPDEKIDIKTAEELSIVVNKDSSIDCIQQELPLD